MTVATPTRRRSAGPVEPFLPVGTTERALERLFPTPNPYVDDPNGWVRDKLGEHLWSKQEQIGLSVRDHRYTAVQSCHDTGKSYRVSRLVDWWIDVHPVGTAFAVTTAPTQPQVEAILWREIERAHRKGHLEGRITGDAKWKIGTELVAFGRKPADYVDAEQAMQAFQGIHALHVLVVLDEACGIPKWLFDAADALATNENARVIAIGNPDDPASHFAEVCKPGSGWNVIKIGWEDTPAFTGEPVPDELLELLLSETWVEERRQRWGEDSALYQSKVNGEFPDVSDDTVFPPRILAKATGADLPGTALGGYGVDVARYGPDETCVYRNRGGVIRLVASARKQDTEDTADLVGDILASHGPDRVPAMIDAVGIGAGVFDKLRRRDLPVLDFNGGERAFEPDRYINRRAEVFWTLRQQMDDGHIDLDPDDDVLLAQLGKIKWKQVSGGKVQIESKDDMAKRGVKSPDRADAAAMALACPAALNLALLARAATAGKSQTLTGDLLERQL